MKKFLISILLFFCFVNPKANELSDSLRISLLTVSPGSELYSTFGHTAIRLTDLKNQYDLVFNYGMFDFRTPNFYFKFALGLLDYQLAIESFEGFMEEFRVDNRSVVEQELNLTQAQKIRLTSLLLENYKPENRKYRYKFFTDNCSTRPRDVIALAVEDSMILRRPAIESQTSFRKLFTSYLVNMRWAQFGIELVLGRMTDRIAGYDALFLPDNLKLAVDKANINAVPLEKSEQSLFAAQPEKQYLSWFSPLVMALLVLLLSLAVQLNTSISIYYDKVFFFLFGLLGLFISAMSLVSHHAEVQQNFVAIFFIPVIIILPFLREKTRKRLSQISFVIIALAFICIPFLPQTFNLAVLLLSLAVALRLFFNFAKVSKKGISIN